MLPEVAPDNSTICQAGGIGGWFIRTKVVSNLAMHERYYTTYIALIMSN